MTDREYEIAAWMRTEVDEGADSIDIIEGAQTKFGIAPKEAEFLYELVTEEQGL
jgi:hypothetical protein